jgi:hypothetical protein
VISRIRSHLTFANVVALIALFAAVGGAAYAAGGGFVSPNGTIQVCVKGGTLEVARVGHRCPRGSASLPFNQAGRAGAPGRDGGPAWYAYETGGPHGVDFTNTSGRLPTPKTIASRFLPAGSYSITAKVNLQISDNAVIAGAATCALVDQPTSGTPTEDPGTWSGTADYALGGNYYGYGGIPFGLDITTTHPTTISVQCSDYTGASPGSQFAISASDAEISAVRVTAVS